MTFRTRTVSSIAWLVLSWGCGAPPVDDATVDSDERPVAAIDAPAAPVGEDRTPPGDAAPDVRGVTGPQSNGVDEAGRTVAHNPDDSDDETSGDAPGPMIHTPREAVDFPDARFRRPEHVRGLYVNAWAAGSSRRMGELIDLARRTEVNSLVIDVKDATGYISHTTEVPLAHQIGATGERRIRDLPALLDRLEDAGIYPIARIVVVKDPILSTFRPEYAVQDTAGGVWVDSKDIVWLNPYSEDVWAYHVQIAREVAEMGFPEIQWDYIRFPDAPQSDLARAVYLGAEGKEPVQAIREFLAYARESLSDLPVRSTADVFGVTTSFRRDVGIGQLWESFIDVVDVALPMVYPSHYWEGSFGYDRPNAYPYEIVARALRDALARSATVEGAGLTRPWLQDFSLGQPIYGSAEVRAQIQATYDVGIQEWVLWNPSSRYTESALEPVEGFEREPLVRVAGVLTPVSRRRIVLDSVAELPPPPVPVDTASVDGRVDTLPVDSMPSDTASTLSDPDSASDTILIPVDPDSTISDTTFTPTDPDSTLSDTTLTPTEPDSVLSDTTLTPTEPDSVLSDTTSVRPDTVSIR
jgi:hypothetical protein